MQRRRLSDEVAALAVRASSALVAAAVVAADNDKGSARHREKQGSAALHRSEAMCARSRRARVAEKLVAEKIRELKLPTTLIMIKTILNTPVSN